MNSRLKKNCGFTLMETILAMAVSALVMASVTVAFQVGRQSWNQNTLKADLLQHCRLAMGRMMAELQYAQTLQSVTADTLQFSAVNLSGTTYQYQIVNGVLQRTVDGGTPAVVAGDSLTAVLSFVSITPKKLDGSGNLVNLDVGDMPSVAIALEVAMQGQAPTINHILKLKSMVKFRNP